MKTCIFPYGISGKAVHIAIVLVFLAFSNILSASADKMLTIPEEILLSPYHQGTLLEDLPIKDCYIDEESPTVWLLGNTSLWRWSLAPLKLERIKIKTDSRDSDTVLDSLLSKPNSNQFFITSNTTLFQIMLFPDASLRRFRHPDFQGGETVAAVVGNDAAYWFHTNATLKIDLQSQKISKLNVGFDFQPGDHIWLDARPHYLWHTSANAIDVMPWTEPLVEKGVRPLSIQTEDPVLDLISDGINVYSYTARNLFRFNPTGFMSNKVIVNPHRTLSKVNIGDRHHLFLFSDGLIEFMDLSDKSAGRYYFPGKSVASIQKICSNPGLLLYLEESRPHLLLLNKEEN